jgi:calcineurin-like phosphoesterase family protein
MKYFWKPLSYRDQKVLFWSDLHLGHDKSFLWGKRGFKSVEEHDRHIHAMLNEYSDRDTIMFILGDVMFGHKGEQRLQKFITSFNYRELNILAGNHHAGYKQLLDASHNGTYVTSIGDVRLFPPYLELYVNKKPIVLSHYPILSWNGQSKGSFHLHGHCHGSLEDNPFIGNTYYKGKVMDVGVEKCPKPISFDEVKKILDKRDKISFDHHDENTQHAF